MQSITLYHDIYETENGDGFFPHLDRELSFKEIEVTFNDENNIWIQQYDSCVSNIKGFDGNQGYKILEELNKLSNKKITIIKDRFGNQIYPKLSK
jgi:hypothetical protein